MSHVSIRQKLKYTCEGTNINVTNKNIVPNHYEMSYVSCMNGSCHTYEGVMPHSKKILEYVYVCNYAQAHIYIHTDKQIQTHETTGAQRHRDADTQTHRHVFACPYIPKHTSTHTHMYIYMNISIYMHV